MPYGHIIPATVLTLGVCEGHSCFQAFSIQTSTSRSPSAIAELLVDFVCLSTSQEIGCKEHPQSYLYCVECDVKM